MTQININKEFRRFQDEMEEEYIYRICSQKEAIGSWLDVAEILNEELNYSYTESKYRKQFQSFEKMLAANKEKFIGEDNYLKEIQIQKDELYKIKRQAYDQRREYNKLQVSDARADNLSEKLIEVANSLNEEKPLNFSKYIVEYRDREAVLCLADWHFGMVTYNIWNEYNIEICKSRVERLVAKIKEFILLNKPKKLHILLLGDASHGSIHTSARVQSEEDACDELMHVAELYAEVIAELSGGVDETFVYSTYGNHLRSIQRKEDSVHSDNMEKIIPWWLEQRFQNSKNINIVYSEYKEFIKLNVYGYNIVCTHGDLDKIKNLGVTVNMIFSKKFNETIDYTISADKHHLEEFEQFDIESILVRSLCGSDDFANSHRLYSSAGQTLMMFNCEDGRESTYNIKLS